MSKVAIVESGSVVYRGALPRSWKNTAGLQHSKDDWDALAEMGIYPLEEVLPSYDSDTEMLDGWTEDIQADKVVLTWNKRSLTDDELTANAEAAATAYYFSRQNEYPEVGDQLDDLFHQGAFSDDMAATLQAVKDAYPKP